MTEGVRLKPDKGRANGSCNRTACQAPLTHEPEHQFMEGNLTGGPRLHYCRNCALLFDRVDNDNRLRGVITRPNRIMREAKTAGRAALAAAPPPPDAPTRMVLHCPKCGLQHIDEAVSEQDGEGREIGWSNPPHRSHLCHGCGHIWRPADVPTEGVAAIQSRGKADSPIAVSRGLDREEVARLIDPDIWAARDRVLSGEPYTPWHAELDATLTRPSLAKADAIIALSAPPPTDKPE